MPLMDYIGIFGTKFPHISLGECCPEENCDLSFRPVCDSKRQTHVNECVFRKNACLGSRKNNWNIAIDYQGECCARNCTQEWKPVCDGKITHPNLCMFK